MFTNKFPFKLATTAVAGTIIYKNFTENNPTLQPHYALTNNSRRFYPASAEFPDVKKNRNIMARSLNEQIYAKLRDVKTSNGFTIDDAIQTGIDNIGKFSTTGCIAGDEETYQLFRELFDHVIFERHGFKKDQRQVNNTDASKLKNATFDAEFVQSIRVRTIRNISGYCFPSYCTRGERRDVESLIARALYEIDKIYKGVYYSLKELTSDEEEFLAKNNLSMERPYMPEEVSANLAREWPDARGLWINYDGTLAVFVNEKDHAAIASIEKTNDLRYVFDQVYTFTKRLETQLKARKWKIMYNNRLGYLTTDPKDLGTALKLSVRIKLTHLSKDQRISALLKMVDLSQKYKVVGEATDGILEISSSRTMGKSEIEITQDFINSVNKLITAEKSVASGGLLEDILYKD